MYFSNFIRKFSQSLCTGYVQLWLSQEPDHTKWAKFESGIICLIKDKTENSYYLKLFDLEVRIY